MLGEKQAAEEAIVVSTEADGAAGNSVETVEDQPIFSVKNMLWHGSSAWFSCASNQVAQVLLTLPYSFSQLAMVLGVVSPT